jgi:protein-histidine pros-kinase
LKRSAACKKYPDFSYREATLNPTNPRDRSAEWETAIINGFRQGSNTEATGERQTASGASLYIARPIKISTPPVWPAIARQRRHRLR